MRIRWVVLFLIVACLGTYTFNGALAGSVKPPDDATRATREIREAAGETIGEVGEPAGEVFERAVGDKRTGSAGTQTSGGSSQGFVSYPVPETMPNAHGAGEPSIGVDSAGRAFLLLYSTVARATFDDSVFPPTVAAWDDVSPIHEPPANLDPILYTDLTTHRTFLAQLLGAGSYGAFTDDSGASWTPTQPPSAAPSFDHQTVGAGPYPAAAATPHSNYPNALYYCAQGGVTPFRSTDPNNDNSASQCARSDTGGLTWGPPVPINVFQCGGLHGKVVVDPAGSVYVPNRSCPDGDVDLRRQGLIVSRDAGVTWTPIVIPGTTQSHFDPAVTFDAAGRGYFLGNRDGHPVVSTSNDGGQTWSNAVDIGTSFGLQNNEFSMAIAGDPGRATVAYLGTPTGGDDQAPDFAGNWHLYVSSTYDGGATWATVDATPVDPVQRGCIWAGGGSNPCRNLLDFDSITSDAQGRVIIGYADGCTGPCAASGGTPAQSRDALGVIARQVTGQRLFAAFDPTGPSPLSVTTGGPYTTTAGSPITVAASALGGTAPLTYAWDLNGDGAFGDATGQTATFPATTAGSFPISVQVTDSSGSATKCRGPKKKCPGPQQAVASTSVTVKPPPAPKSVLQSWSFDGADGMCDAQGFTTFTLAADPLAPAAQTQKWHTVTEQAASGPCAWYHGVDQLQTYPSAQYTSLMSPCIDLSGLTTASADFKYAGELWAEDDGTPVDYLDVGVTPCDANDFTGIAQFSGVAGELDASPAVYKTATVDLTPYAGQKVKVEFDIHTNLAQVGYRGYQIDDVSLLGS